MDLKQTVFGDEDERGVSPVIGVILMVAITVILAAVIAMFVLDLGSSVGEEANAGVDIEEDGAGAYDVSWVSQGNADSVEVGSCTMTDVGDSCTGVSEGTAVIAVSGETETQIATVE